MNKKFWSYLATSGVLIIGALATNGKGLVEAASAAFDFMLVISAKAPLGLGSFALASALAVMAQAFAHRYAKSLPCPRSGDFLLGLLAFAIGAGVMWLQLPTRNGMLLGILAGFSAPFLFQALAALWNLVIGKPADPNAKGESLDE